MNPLFERATDRARLIGVVHLLPLPGGPVAGPPLDEVIARAVADARALAAGGADAAIVENLGDAPFTGEHAEPFTVAAMTRVAIAIQAAAPALPLGINVLRNDARAALAIAAAIGATFIRVNVHVGTMVTDQGLLTGRARDTLLDRRRLDAPVAIAADVLVKHAVPLGAQTIEQAASDTWRRGRANALIVTGRETGAPLDPHDLARVRASVPEATLWAGSGVTPDTSTDLRGLIDSAIVGTWLHTDGDRARPVDPERVRTMRASLHC